MYRIKLFIIFLGLLSLWSCKSKDNIIASSSEFKESLNFPLDWIGDYEGPLKIYNTKGGIDTISMRLVIDYPNAQGYFPWTIIYDNNDVRPYGLEVINADKGLYRINEYNSIELDAYLIDRHLITRFSVMQNDLIIDYEHTGDAITAQFYISGVEHQNITGGEVIGQDTIPNVNTYPLSVYQKAILKKKD
jgi:hypothetical protein